MNKENLETISGAFVYTIYKSDNYMVCKFETEDDTITVTGNSFDYIKGEKYTLNGEYIDHPKYGFQFNIFTISRFIPNKEDEIIRFLSSKAFPAIGKKAAKKIYEKLGEDCLNKLFDNPNLAYAIDLNAKQIKGLLTGIENMNDETNEAILLLISSGFSNSEANRIYYEFKENTMFIINFNPFRIYLDIPGMSFSKVLQCAKTIEFEDKEIKFKEAYLVYIFKELTFNSGHTYLEYEEFRKVYEKDYHDLDDILDICIKDGEIILEDNRYYYKQEFYDEVYIANYLKEFTKGKISNDDMLLNDYIEEYENLYQIKYDDLQKEAIRSFFEQKFSLIIGGPGTGKTTLIKTLVSMFKDINPYNNIIVIAPTGRAAKRVNEICDVESKTIHSLLKWNKEDNTFVHKEDNPILYDCLIIDEFSMVDNNLFASLLKASINVKKICIIGDNKQLPSIRQGNLLNDLIESNIFKITYLKYNYRQKEGNDIINLANDIANLSVDFDSYNNDVSFLDINSINIANLINMINNDLNEGNVLDDIQILSPMYKGEYGIDNLNVVLQNSFNPKAINKNEKRIGKFIFRENDKILQLKNRPNDDVYNGDIGILEEVNEKEKNLIINYQGGLIFYEFNDTADISLAYAMSVHKAQGSEYNIVYFICSKAHTNMLYKQLIYTAISRAKNKLVIIGDKNAFFNGIKRELTLRRTTLLNRLTS